MTDRREIDRELVKRVHAGDDSAFTALMGYYKGPILNFAYRLTGKVSLAEEIAEDAFVKAYHNLSRFTYRSARDQFSSWLFQLARHAAYDAIRYQQRHPTQPMVSTDPRELADRSPDPATDASNREREARVAAAIADLPEDQRTALVLSVYEALSYVEIAAIMKCSAKSVEARLYRARKTLKGLLLSL